MHTNKILMVGCGSLGIATARLLQSQGYHVIGARRSVNKLPADIAGLTLDLADIKTLDIVGDEPWAAIIVTLTADSFDETAYRATYVDGLKNLLESISDSGVAADQPRTGPLLIFASSTSIYGQNDGSVVDEDSTTDPDSFSGKAMLSAETLLQRSTVETCAIRFGGIYGRTANGRLLRQLSEGTICPSEPALYSNRIHFDDCCRIFAHLVERYVQHRPVANTYLAVDSAPAPLREVMEWLAEAHDIPLSELRDGPIPRRGGNKRCNNRRLLDSGFEFRFPDYKSGFSAV